MSHHPNWKGGKTTTGKGYIKILNPNHPKADSKGYILEHRVIMEKHIGRYLEPHEIVHHKNENRQDNRIENLQLMTKREHQRHHIKLKVESIYKEMKKRFCSICNSKTTYKTRGTPDWRVNPITGKKWICAKCYRRIWSQKSRHRPVGQ